MNWKHIMIAAAVVAAAGAAATIVVSRATNHKDKASKVHDFIAGQPK